MRLAVSHTYFNKKLDELGQAHDAPIHQILDVERKMLQKKFPKQDPEAASVQEQAEDCNTEKALMGKYCAERLALIAAAPLPDLDIDFSVPVLKKCHRGYLDWSCRHFIQFFF